MVRHEPLEEDDGEEKVRSRRIDDEQRGDTVAGVLDQVLWMLFICSLELTTLCSGSRL